MDEIPEWFRFPHLIIFFCTVISLYFIYQIISNIFWKEASSEVQIQKSTKIILMFSILLSYSYLIITTFQSIFMFIPLSLNMYPPSLCPFLSSYRMFSYVSGRSILYLFFISRTDDIFRGSYLQYSNKCKWTLIIYCVAVPITVIAGAATIYFTMQNWRIISSTNKNIGTYCIATDKMGSNASRYIKYVFIWGSLNDTFYALLTLSLLKAKLFTLIIESENKRKNVHSRFSINTQLSSISHRDRGRSLSNPVDSGCVDTVQSPPNSPKLDSPKLDSAVITNTNCESPPAVSPEDALEFHRKTEDHNHIILLITKFFILLCCAIGSSLCVLALFVKFRDMVLILYSLDTCINTICLYLSFVFAEKYYNRYLCGRYCTECCFPFTKTITMQCSAYERHYKKTRQLNKFCVYCKCCCFGYCFDEKINWESSKAIYDLAKFEVELMIMSDIGKQMIKQKSDQ